MDTENPNATVNENTLDRSLVSISSGFYCGQACIISITQSDEKNYFTHSKKKVFFHVLIKFLNILFQKIHDKFCWECDKSCKNAKHKCSKCFRVMHDSCLHSTNKIYRTNADNSLSVCSVCVALENSKKNIEGQ